MLSTSLVPSSAHMIGSDAHSPSLTPNKSPQLQGGEAHTAAESLVTPASRQKPESSKGPIRTCNKVDPRWGLAWEGIPLCRKKAPHTQQGPYPTLVHLCWTNCCETIKSMRVTTSCSSILPRRTSRLYWLKVGWGLLVWDGLGENC